MTFKTKILSVLLILNIVQIYAEPLKKTLLEKTLGFVTQSKPMYLFEKYIQTKINNQIRKLTPLGTEPASPEYQELGQEAQHELGIPQERHVSTKKISPTSIMAHYVGALAEPDAIYVNEEKLNQRSYGARRCAMFHEAVHKKYNDLSTDQVIEWGTMIGSSIVAHKLIKFIKPQGRYNILHGIGVLASGLGMSFWISKKYHHYMERRADIEGHYATQCFVCVQESAVLRCQLFEQEDNPFKNKGYLWAVDLEEIAQDLRVQNKICTYHQKHK